MDSDCSGECMKIKCFDATELPIEEWQESYGTNAEIFCWPVASDFSLRASLSQVSDSNYLKQYTKGKRLCVSLDNGNLSIVDCQQQRHSMAKIGDTFYAPAQQLAKLELQGSSVRLLNLLFNPERWSVTSQIITQEHRLPIGQAGMVYVLAGEWDVFGANCNSMKVNQGGWWLPDIGEGHLTPSEAGSKLIWLDITAYSVNKL